VALGSLATLAGLPIALSAALVARRIPSAPGVALLALLPLVSLLATALLWSGTRWWMILPPFVVYAITLAVTAKPAWRWLPAAWPPRAADRLGSSELPFWRRPGTRNVLVTAAVVSALYLVAGTMVAKARLRISTESEFGPNYRWTPPRGCVDRTEGSVEAPHSHSCDDARVEVDHQPEPRELREVLSGLPGWAPAVLDGETDAATFCEVESGIASRYLVAVRDRTLYVVRVSRLDECPSEQDLQGYMRGWVWTR
jgi:hypothetical protein